MRSRAKDVIPVSLHAALPSRYPPYAMPILLFLALEALWLDVLSPVGYALLMLYLTSIRPDHWWDPEHTGIALAICAGVIVLGYLYAGPATDPVAAAPHQGLFPAVAVIIAGLFWEPPKLNDEWDVSRDREQLLFEQVSRQRAEEALHDAQVRFRSIFESFHDGFAYTSFDGSFLEVNSAMEKLSGRSRDELLAMTHADLIAPEYAAIEEAERQELNRSGRAVERELAYARKDGSRIPVCVNTFMVRGRDGAPTGLAMIVKDLTDRKQTEIALRKTAEELHKKNEQLAQANQLLSAAQREAARVQRLSAIGQFAATVAHKIGTPLTALSGHVQLLKEDHSLAPHVRARLQIVETQIERTSGIIQDLLVYARRPDPVWTVVDVNHSLNDCFALFQTECVRQQVACTVIPSATPATVSADRQQLQEALNHLVENALQAMPEGGTLTLRTFLTESSSAEADKRVGIEIADTGTGIAPEHLAPIFQPFFTTKTMGRGTGLGLAIVQETVRAHSGQITVESEPGKGSRFTILLPFVRTSP